MARLPEPCTPSTAHVREVYALQHGALLADEHRREFDRWLSTRSAPTPPSAPSTGLRLTVTVDLDERAVRTHGDLANVLRATANRIELEHRSADMPDGEAVGITTAPSGAPVGLWSIGARHESIPELRARLAAATGAEAVPGRAPRSGRHCASTTVLAVVTVSAAGAAHPTQPRRVRADQESTR